MTVQRLRVPVGFLYAALFLYFSQPRPWLYAAGLLLALLGLLIRLWATGHLEKWQGLVTSGPYRYTRNPLYFGSFILGLGLTLAGSVVWLVVLYAVLFLAFYYPVMRREEDELQAGYQDPFPDYRKRVPLFFPALRPAWPKSDRRFSWTRVKANREYNAVLGFLILSLLIGIKMW
ncbi:MAG TPA: isoprenylcysteine carboxylmethyltransferase family protein [Acidobacteriota bacterium]|nr:isoprenylcysteine carboxylmethyltransferase family protein [Acidobacteriota bacterium]